VVKAKYNDLNIEKKKYDLSICGLVRKNTLYLLPHKYRVFKIEISLQFLSAGDPGGLSPPLTEKTFELNNFSPSELLLLNSVFLLIQLNLCVN